MRKIYVLVLAVLIFAQATGQVAVTYTINTTQERHTISRYIYGINNGVYKRAVFRRWGGNRTSAYNWENNFSNAGVDYINDNDNYLPYIFGLAPGDYLKPAACVMAFQDTSLSQGAFSAVTLPMVGYVSNDGNGVVGPTELAPSPRWDTVINVKPTPVSLVPDTTDHTVYVNEELNTLINAFGTANTGTGIKGYVMDNEPGLWCDQFPHMRAYCVTYNELFTKSISLANTVKTMDDSAKVFGPESYGFGEYWNLQSASDAGNYSNDHWFVDSYLRAMKHASDSVGKRLLDVFSVHWYPEYDQTNVSIFSDDTSQATAMIRMQRPRTLWDSTYTENTWIPASGFAADLPIVPHILNSIAQYYPGTKMGITEYDYGAHSHISGGIAEADVLGIFGKCGLDFASMWTAPAAYVTAAFDIYRNYDGSAGVFGDTHIAAICHDSESSIYASVSDTSNALLHAIVINKSYTNTITATVNIQGGANYNAVEGYYFDEADSLISQVQIPASAISNNVFTYTIPPLTVYHFVFRDTATLGVGNVATASNLQLQVSPNPAVAVAHISYAADNNSTLTVTDALGKMAAKYHVAKGAGQLDISSLAAGTFIFSLTDGISLKTEKVTVIK